MLTCYFFHRFFLCLLYICYICVIVLGYVLSPSSSSLTFNDLTCKIPWHVGLAMVIPSDAFFMSYLSNIGSNE